MKHLFAACLLAAAACGGTPETAKTPGGAGSGSGTVAMGGGPNDVVIEVPAIELKGLAFEPEALERPGMMLSPPKKKTTLDALRATIAKTKDVETRQAYTIGLATMLYEDGKTNKANADKDIAEARQALRDAVAAAGDKTDDLTLKFLGVYEYYLGDYAGAEKAYSDLIAKSPKDKDLDTSRAWLALAQLKQGKNADALKTVKDVAVSDKAPDLAYVTAWAKLRSGDDAGAWQGIVAASKGWAAKELPNKAIVDRDVFVFAAHANVPLTDAVPVIVAISPKDQGKQFESVAKLGLQGYSATGRWTDAIAAGDKAFEIGGKAVTPSDTAAIRISDANFTVALDTPEVAIGYAKAALDAVVGCGAKCDKDKADIVQSAYALARTFHLVYATSNDMRYYQPAHDLYGIVAPIADADLRSAVLKDQTAIDQTHAYALKQPATKPVGTHDKGAIGTLLQRHNAEVVGCYERALFANAKTGGALTLHLETDQTGAIKGVSTEPKAGLDELAGVAGCVAEHAKLWKLPKRGIAGTTRIKLSYTLSRMAKK